ncbi:hypothetical protein GQE99_16240 [Maritimibacter sp. DP07]|uniref:Uncharacterized protein n=1 Tax=Maritimibacter harenae TaxID=2606218 RepID=A0A845M2J5_9RHOB|nr:hypothetical protein [Maritimibacter harenae]MZR14570.1 hypothetical protein [Maritimibacter harenae]
MSADFVTHSDLSSSLHEAHTRAFKLQRLLASTRFPASMSPLIAVRIGRVISVLSRQSYMTDEGLAEVEGLSNDLQVSVEAETHYGFVCDDCHTDGGVVTSHLTAAGEVLAHAKREVDRFIAAATDARAWQRAEGW